MIDMNVGIRIKSRRKELGLTQTQIYEHTKINSGNLSKIENGKVLPSSSALIGLSEILQCSIDYILRGDSSKLKGENFCNFEEPNTFDISPTEETFVNCLRQLPSTDQDDVIRYLNSKIRALKGDKKIVAKSSNSLQEKSSEYA